MPSQDSLVYVGLSGGVDSAVSAALLKEGGVSVVGVFIKIWRPEFLECTWERDRLDAMRVAAHLGIPFRELNLSAEYKRQVIDTMVAGYMRGETPNPDTLCNERIKFGSFYEWARKEGAHFVATGHYAQTNDGKLFRGRDADKDQSYFLYGLSKDVLSHTLFPVGGITKPEVRLEAKRLLLPNAGKLDSQGLCFVGDVSMREFLSRYIRIEHGTVLDPSGRVVGEHGGAAFYTVGQRHGFFNSGTSGVPHYVVDIDTEKNIVRISPRREDALSSEITVRDARWVSGLDDSARARAVQVRYREADAPCEVSRSGEKFSVRLQESRVAARGQAAVFFDRDECLGGGIIA